MNRAACNPLAAAIHRYVSECRRIWGADFGGRQIVGPADDRTLLVTDRLGYVVEEVAIDRGQTFASALLVYRERRRPG